jgi:hypothetical protein
VEEFVAGYVSLKRNLYSRRRRAATLVPDVAGFLARGYPLSACFEAVDLIRKGWDPHPDRTFIAGTDTVPPEATAVPFDDADFATDAERVEVMGPWPITDHRGRVLPQWRNPVRTFSRRGDMSLGALGLAGPEQSLRPKSP